MNETVNTTRMPASLRDLAEQQTPETQRRLVEALSLTELQKQILDQLKPREGFPPHSLTTDEVRDCVEAARSQVYGDADPAVYEVGSKKVYNALNALRRKGLVEGANGKTATNRVRVWSLVQVPSVA